MPHESTAIGPSLERLRRLQYLTKNFGALQGLMTAAIGIEFLAFRISDLLEHSWLGFLMLGVGIAVGIVAIRRIPGYYESQFGQVEQQSPPITRGDAIGCLAVLAGLIVLAVFSGPLGRFFSYIWTVINDHLNAMFAGPGHRLNFLPVVFWLAALVLNIPAHFDRLIDLRKTILYFGGTAAWVAIMCLPLYHSNLVNLTWWKVIDGGWLCISLVIIGLYDHLTLVWLLSKTSEVEQ